ncbi:alpha-amylase family glycosyl hydrolase [Ferruginibacter sp. SUN002]|uniref:alpha-amylase family glycosyl hydrolase n=1 Tax=Ferruginibacter sp. SUN002 TaxID=2937789 RepID=UPI003D35C0DF
MKKNLLYALLLLLSACNKFPDFPEDPVKPGTDNEKPLPAQYGTPFANVPDPRDAVIYEVNMRAFSSTGNFNGVKARLDEIKALGVNVLYLMPIHPIGVLKTVNSPYCVKNYEGINSAFGNLDDLRTLVAEAHNRDMAVIFDWVADHTAWDHPWIANKAWYKQNSAGEIISPPNTNWTDVAQLNYGNATMRLAMIREMKYWIFNANIDGYRCDAADFVPVDFWQQANDSLNNITTHKLLLFAEGTRDDHYTAKFQMRYGMEFYYTLKDDVFANGETVKLIDNLNASEYASAIPNVSQVVRYITNHDVNLAEGVPQDFFGGIKGSIATFMVAAYMKGVPMFYNGQEVACPTKLDYFNTSTPINWSINASTLSEYKKIMAFRKTNEALRRGTLTSYSSNDVCAFTKISGAQKVLVLVNLRNSTINYSVPAALQNTSWQDAFDNTATTVGTSVSLQPYSYLVLKVN